MAAILSKYYNFFDGSKKQIAADVGALVLRLGFAGTIAVAHGYGKLMGFSEGSANFPDPLHIGHKLSMASAIGAEFFCGILVAIGLFTRLTVLPLIFTMLVAGILVHASDPFGKKELAVMYLVGFVAIFFVGPGRFSVDGLLSRK